MGYDWEKDPEYVEYLEREKRDAHMCIYDDWADNPELTEEDITNG